MPCQSARLYSGMSAPRTLRAAAASIGATVLAGATQEDLLGAMSHIYPRHTPTHGAPDATPAAADGAVYRDGGSAPTSVGPLDEAETESTLERSMARRALLDQ